MISNRLPALWAEVFALHGEVTALAAQATQKSIILGERLIEAKQLVAHGGWRDWLNQTGVSERTAQRYMRLASSGLKSATVADLGGIREADRFLAWHRREGLEKWPPQVVAETIVEGRAIREKEIEQYVACSSRKHEKQTKGGW